jgi:hypothetical protein
MLPLFVIAVRHLPVGQSIHADSTMRSPGRLSALFRQDDPGSGRATNSAASMRRLPDKNTKAKADSSAAVGNFFRILVTSATFNPVLSESCSHQFNRRSPV